MSQQPAATPANQQQPEHRLVIRGRILSRQPLTNIRVLEQTSGQVADVEVEVFYRFRNLARTEGEGETSYQLWVCLNAEEAIETVITIPAATGRVERSYDLDLDQLPRKVISLVTKANTTQIAEQPVSETPANFTKSRMSPEKSPKNK